MNGAGLPDRPPSDGLLVKAYRLNELKTVRVLAQRQKEHQTIPWCLWCPWGKVSEVKFQIRLSSSLRG